jgi:pyruvate formate lyase activating enzyme
MEKAILSKKIGENITQCLACSWYCKIAPGKVGICATRLNRNGVLYSLVYGKAIGLHLDPVEKKPLHHFLPGVKVLSFGTLGCNFSCLFCQNWEMSQINKSQPRLNRGKNSEKELTELIDQLSITISPAEIVEMAKRKKACGIAYTYNEPAIFVEFTHDTAKLAKKKGLYNIYVSNGFESIETFNFVKDYIDAINIDLKSFRNEFYQKVSRAKLSPVLDNIKRFFQAGIETEVTTLIIPNFNDSKQELTAIANFLANISTDIPWHISAFYPAYKMLDVPPTPHKTLIQAYDIGKKAGLRYVYIGNVPDLVHSSTYCPKCDQLLISRLGYKIEIKEINLKTGCCKNCNQKIYGIWN